MSGAAALACAGPAPRDIAHCTGPFLALHICKKLGAEEKYRNTTQLSLRRKTCQKRLAKTPEGLPPKGSNLVCNAPHRGNNPRCREGAKCRGLSGGSHGARMAPDKHGRIGCRQADARLSGGSSRHVPCCAGVGARSRGREAESSDTTLVKQAWSGG